MEDYKGIEIRSMKISGKTWAVASDICKVLDILVCTGMYKLKPAHSRKQEIISTYGRPVKAYLVDSAGAKYIVDRANAADKEQFKAWLAENIFTVKKPTLPKEVEAELVEVDKELDKTLPVVAGDVQPFFFDGGQVRATVINSEPWFVAKDVAEVIGLSWIGSKAIAHVPEQWKGVGSIPTPGGNQAMSVLSEQGVYFFLNRSDKPAALPLQMWISGEVLPTIRKTGTYSVPNSDYYVPSTHAEALRLAADLSERNYELVAKIEADAHKVAFADHVSASTTSISVRRFAKILHDNDGLDVGEHRLFDWLRKAGYLMHDNTPYQTYMTAGYFEVVEKVRYRNGSSDVPYTQTLVTGKGQIAITDHILQVYPNTEKVARKRVTREMLADNRLAA